MLQGNGNQNQSYIWRLQNFRIQAHPKQYHKKTFYLCHPNSWDVLVLDEKHVLGVFLTRNKKGVTAPKAGII